MTLHGNEVHIMEKGLVSIVVPIYKTEKYLDRCIDSLVNQTYRKIEIVLVDDGSPDQCPAICDRWAAQDSRVKVIHKHNEGLGLARNSGIKNATGEYICFLDSDDYVDEYTIEKAYCAAIIEQVDVVVFGFHTTDEQGNVISSFVPRMEKDTYYGAEVQEVFLPELIAPNLNGDGNRRLYMSACMMLFSHDMIKKNDWLFVSEKKIISEDVYSLLDIFQYVRSVRILGDAFYFYRTNTSSVSRSYRPDRYIQIRHFYLESKLLCQKLAYSDTIISRLADPYLAFTIAAMKQIVSADITYAEKQKMLCEIINDDVLQSALMSVSSWSYGLARRALLIAMRYRSAIVCWLLIKAQLLKNLLICEIR